MSLRIYQQQMDYYTKAMGGYSSYESAINAFNALPDAERTQAAADALPKAPVVKAPSFTHSQAANLQNPPPTYSDYNKSEQSRLTQNADFRPFGNTSEGILQRVMKGQV